MDMNGADDEHGAVIPGGGWMISWTADGEEYTEPLVAWKILARSGGGVPLVYNQFDPDDYCSTVDDVIQKGTPFRIWHPDAKAVRREDNVTDVADAMRERGETMSRDEATSFLDWIEANIVRSVNCVVTALDGDALSGKQGVRLYEAMKEWMARRALEWREETGGGATDPAVAENGAKP